MLNLDPKIRKAIYLALVAIGGILVVFNVVQQDQVDNLLNIVGLLLGAGGGALAFVNTPPSGKHSKE